jgi:hypothetical protein
MGTASCRAGYEAARSDAIGILCGRQAEKFGPSDYLIISRLLRR